MKWIGVWSEGAPDSSDRSLVQEALDQVLHKTGPFVLLTQGRGGPEWFSVVWARGEGVDCYLTPTPEAHDLDGLVVFGQGEPSWEPIGKVARRPWA